jgi:hypothetical protein
MTLLTEPGEAHGGVNRLLPTSLRIFLVLDSVPDPRDALAITRMSLSLATAVTQLRTYESKGLLFSMGRQHGLRGWSLLEANLVNIESRQPCLPQTKHSEFRE